MPVANRTPPAKFKRLYGDPKLSARQIADACGFSHTKEIHVKAAKLGIPRRHFQQGRPRIAVREDVMRLRLPGASTRQIATALGCSATSVRNAIREMSS